MSKGFIVGEQSVDRTSAPYEVARGAFYDGRVEAPWHEKAISEWTRRYDWIQMLSRVSPSTKQSATASTFLMYSASLRSSLFAFSSAPMSA